MRLPGKIISGALVFALLGTFFVPAHEARAAVSFGAVGTAAAGTNSLSIPYPTGVAAGNLLVMSIANKHPTAAPTVPAGWQAVHQGQWSGGIGASAADSGAVYSTVFLRVADGTESGNVSVTITSGNCAVGAISRYAKTSSAWDVVAAREGDNIAGHNNWSVTATTSLSLASGDMVITSSAINSDLATFASQSLSATGATVGSHTERVDAATANGNDCGLVVATHAVTAGSSSSGPVFTMTSGSNNATAPTGATIFLRIREVATGAADTTITSPVSVTGSISVLGALAKGAGTFVIDHPLDPKNKLLYHSFVESPEVKNIYDGIAVLDRRGEATIELPAYFLALNRNYRYLATPVGEPMPQLHLSQRVRPKWFGWFGTPAFKLSGGEPGGRVSWQVSGVRQDPFILKHPVVPEVPKGPNEIVNVGEYICVECYE